MGFLVSFAWSCWLVIGKFLWGVAPTLLPLSVHGCNNTSSIMKATVTSLYSTISSNFTNTNAITSTINTTTSSNEQPGSVYDLSYCYVGVGGMLLMMVVASVVSLLTGQYTFA